MSELFSYLPQDRVISLAKGQALPDRAQGSVLFADISGFTPLTEALVQTRGLRHGAEELPLYLNRIYSALIAEIDRYAGSVISFAGDAITCWFDEAPAGLADCPPAPHRAAACALAMQAAMQDCASINLPNQAPLQLSIKISLASGPARRFHVGDPQVQVMDVLGGATVSRAAVAEHLAKSGEILLDEASVQRLGKELALAEWRVSEETNERFAVLESLALRVEPTPWPASHSSQLTEASLRPWVLPAVYARETAGQGLFLIEFRPAVALFVRFAGLDYDHEDVATQLDRFVQQVQRVLTRYEGTLLQVIVGDKGSYFYAAFGAPIAHEDDARRAVKAALELLEERQGGRIEQLQMGLSQGTMRVGTYGGPTRRTYGVFGDEVNLAARLMQSAADGEIVVSERVQQAVAEAFTVEPCPELRLKGKSKRVDAFVVKGERRQRAIRLQEPSYALPMVGREKELQSITEKLERARQGQAQVIGIVAEAGLGKSRLVAEVIRSARKKGFAGYGGACQSDGVNTPYLVWKSIWSAFFDLDSTTTRAEQIHRVEEAIRDRVPHRVQALPLLNLLLTLSIPENDFTQSLEPKIRQSALHALLEDCLKVAAKDEPLLIVIEDLHWIDALSHDLLEQLAKALVNYRVCFVLAYRPLQAERLQASRLEALPQFTKIELHELNHAEAESAIRAKLTQLYPARSGALPRGLVETLMARAQGNPFYLEELLNYMRDRGLDPSDLSRIELPDSLHTLILSRIDQLGEQEKTTLRVASVVGRLFRARWLTGYYPELGAVPRVKGSLEALESLDITPLDSPEPELAYLFKHIVTHEVTYESLPFATRARLHEQLARYLENAYPDSLPLEALAFHYGCSENTAKQIEYLHKAGEAAQKNYANAAALNYYGALLPLLQDPTEKVPIHLKRGEVLELLGKYTDAENDYRAALECAQDDLALKASAQFALGKLNRLRGDYARALEWLEQAQAARTQLKDTAGLAQGLLETGTVLWRKGAYAQAREILNEGLVLARAVDNRLRVASALHNLGNVALNQGDYAAARALNEESLSLKREMGDKYGIAMSLNNLGNVTFSQGDYGAARALYEESLSLKREMGDKAGIAMSLNNLGVVAERQGDYPVARALYEGFLSLVREIGDKYGIAMSLNNLGVVALNQGEYPVARALFKECLSLRREMGDKWGIAVSLSNLGSVAANQGEYAAARALLEERLSLAREMGDKTGIAMSLNALGNVVTNQGDYAAARVLLEESLSLNREMGDKAGIAMSLNNLGNVASNQGDYAAARALLEESLSLGREMGSKAGIAVAVMNLGQVAYGEGNLEEATAFFRDSLEQFRALGDKLSFAFNLAGLATVAAGAHSRRAAQLGGATAALLKTLGTQLHPAHQGVYDRALDSARAQLGEEAFQSAWAEGEKMTLDEATALALAKDAP